MAAAAEADATTIITLNLKKKQKRMTLCVFKTENLVKKVQRKHEASSTQQQQEN